MIQIQHGAYTDSAKYLIRLVTNDTYEIMYGPTIEVMETSVASAVARAGRELSYSNAQYDGAELIASDGALLARIAR